MNAVTVDTIRKTYGREKKVAVDNISFEVSAGEVFGLIGPDGAGKTSLFRMLATLLLPDGGKAAINGMDVVSSYRAIRKTIGYMPGRFSLYQDLTVQENLEFFATLFDTTIAENYGQIKEIFDQLKPFSSRRAGKLSGGMKQKLALCCALIHRPDLLLLDEPTTGVDPVSRREFWQMLARLKKQGITIIVSTPYMDEAARCDRIALMQDGRLLSVNTPAAITASFGEQLFRARADDNFKLLQALRGSPDVGRCYAFGEYIHFTLADKNPGPGTPVPRGLSVQGDTGLIMELMEPTIEDSFIKLSVE